MPVGSAAVRSAVRACRRPPRQRRRDGHRVAAGAGVQAAQLLWRAQAALDAEVDEPRAKAGNPNHRLRHLLIWGALPLLALVASATVVSGLT